VGVQSYSSFQDSCWRLKPWHSRGGTLSSWHSQFTFKHNQRVSSYNYLNCELEITSMIFNWLILRYYIPHGSGLHFCVYCMHRCAVTSHNMVTGGCAICAAKSNFLALRTTFAHFTNPITALYCLAPHITGALHTFTRAYNIRDSPNNHHHLPHNSGTSDKIQHNGVNNRVY
jgi:hypothetical protein